ncbi:unnamed protein product [Symbiodinium sp. CCMP2592]|nr:unnamed protein product [Symbiodinium sp. CCMP2592]
MTAPTRLAEIRFWLGKIGSLPSDPAQAHPSLESLQTTLMAVHLSSGSAELGDLVVGQMCQKLLDIVRKCLAPHSTCMYTYNWSYHKTELELQLHAVRACIDSRLSWGSDQAPPSDTSDLELHRALDLFRNEFAPASVGQDAANRLGLLRQEMQALLDSVAQDAASKVGLLRQEMQTLRSEFAPAAVVQDAANKLGLLQQEMQTLRSEFAPAAVVQDAANELGLLQQEMQTLRSEFAPAAAANELGLLRQEMQDLRNEFASSSMEKDVVAEVGLLQDLKETVTQISIRVDQLEHWDGRCHGSEHLAENISRNAIEESGTDRVAELRQRCREQDMVKSLADKIEAQQQNMLDSLRRERSGLIQQLANRLDRAGSTLSLQSCTLHQGWADGQCKPSTAGPAARGSDSGSEASWVCLSRGGSDTQGSSSVRSGISVETAGCNCFMHDAAFKSETGALVPGSALHKGSRVLAADGSVVQANDPEDHEAKATVLLKTGAAELEVTTKSELQLESTFLSLLTGAEVRAKDLRVGDEVLVGGLGPARLQYADVKLEPVMVRKIVFQPDLPVEVLKLSILSHGDKQSKRTRRGGQNRRRSDRQDNCTIPDTEGYLTD